MIAPENLWPSPEAHKKATALIELLQAGRPKDAQALFERHVTDRDHSLCHDEGPCRYECFIAMLRAEAAVLGVNLVVPHCGGKPGRPGFVEAWPSDNAAERLLGYMYCKGCPDCDDCEG